MLDLHSMHQTPPPYMSGRIVSACRRAGDECCWWWLPDEDSADDGLRVLYGRDVASHRGRSWIHAPGTGEWVLARREEGAEVTGGAVCGEFSAIAFATQ